MRSAGIYGTVTDNPVYGVTTDVQIASNGVHGVPRVAVETRPKNVAVLYCIKD